MHTTTGSEGAVDALTRQNIAQALWMKEYEKSSIPPDILQKIESEKNSDRSFAARFQTHLREMMDNLPSFVTSRADRYKVMLRHAESRSPQQCYASTLCLGPESVTGYEAIPLDPKFGFPGIDCPQGKTQVGWHFFVGNFIDELQHHYSVELMLWRYALLPPDLAARLGLSEQDNQMVELQLAISDPQAQVPYRANPAVVAGTTGLVDWRAHPYSYAMGRNRIGSLDQSANLFPARLVARGWDMGKTPNVEIEIDLALDSVKGYFLEGQDGCAPSIDGIGTLYYSAPLLKLSPGHESAITIGGARKRLVEGSMWYDHQWGTGFMPAGAPRHAVMRASQNLSPAGPGGWDWFMMQFHRNDAISPDGEVQLTLSALHTIANESYYWQTGPTPPGVMTASCTGKYIDAQRQVHNVTGVMQVTQWVRSTASPNPALYPASNTWYPAKYQFMVDGPIPEPIRLLTVTPIIASGQTGFFATGIQYTEGGAVITDNWGREMGRGFAEGTNYADTTANVIRLAGLPEDQQTLGFLKAPKVGPLMKIWSLIYVFFNKAELDKILAEAKGL